MRMSHPNLPGVVTTVDPGAFADVWSRRGWVEAPDEPDAPDTSAMTVDEVLAAVGQDPALAAAALAVEQDGKNRKTLTAQLERIAHPTTEEPQS